MSDTIKDAFLLTTASIALCVEILLLLHVSRVITLPIDWGRGYGEGVEIGYIADSKNSVKSRNGHSLSWYPTAQGDRIRLHDSLMTGPQSSAEVRLGDGAVIVEADTMVSFGARREEKGHASVLNLEIGAGRVKVRSRETIVKVKLAHRELSLAPGSEVEVTRAPLAKHSDVQVKKGKIEIQEEMTAPNVPRPTPVALNEGERLRDSAERGIARIETNLRVTPKWPTPGAKIFAKSAPERIGFSWTGDGAETLELSRDDSFQSPRKLSVSGNDVQLDLPPGHYYWRVRRDVAQSTPHDFTILPPARYRLLGPEPESIIKAGTPVTLAWETVEGAVSYHVELSSSPDFNDVLVKSELTSPQTKLEPLAPGRYYWRVRARHPDFGDWPVSGTQRFDIKKKLGTPKPKGAKVKKQGASDLGRFMGYVASLFENVAFAAEQNLDVEVEWEAVDGAAGYRLEISDSKKFRTLLKSVDTRRTSVSVELPPREKYYWRVAARDDDGDISEFSRVEELSAPPPAPMPPPKPVAKAPEPPRAPSEPSTFVRDTFLPTGIAFGVAGVKQWATASANDFSAQVPGRFGALEVALYKRFSAGEARLHATLENLRYRQTDSASASQPDLAQRPSLIEAVFRGRYYFALGARSQDFSDFVRSTDDTLRIDNRSIFFVVGGPTFTGWLDKSWYVTVEALGLVAPVGRARGYGGQGALRFGARKLAGLFSPEIEISYRPFSIRWDASDRKLSTGQARAMLLVGFDFGPEPGVQSGGRPPAAQRPIEATRGS